MRTSYRNILLLACCQALLLTNSAGLISMSALVGYGLVDAKALASLPATTYVIGSALATMPASLWMAKVGRRRGFMAGALVNVVGCAVAIVGLLTQSFVLFCIATAVIGVYNAIGLQYRFAAAEVAVPADRARAISLVLAGGVAGGFLGPGSVSLAKDWFATPFLGSFLLLAAVALVALAVQSLLHVPKPPAHTHGGGRPLSAIARQPVFVIAVVSAALGYGVMNLLMVATPLAMSFCQHPFSAAAFVIQWHVVGMYAPGFVTGDLIRRLGVLPVILIGVLLVGGCVATALAGDTIAHFTFALVLLGVGWNFMYTGGTTLLTESYEPVEKAKVQGLNDFVVFATMGLSSLSSGALVSSAGWERMNLGAIPLLVAIAAAVGWLGWRRRGAPRAA
jgi:MFS family permease